MKHTQLLITAVPLANVLYFALISVYFSYRKITVHWHYNKDWNTHIKLSMKLRCTHPFRNFTDDGGTFPQIYLSMPVVADALAK